MKLADMPSCLEGGDHQIKHLGKGWSVLQRFAGRLMAPWRFESFSHS